MFAAQRAETIGLQCRIWFENMRMGAIGSHALFLIVVVIGHQTPRHHVGVVCGAQRIF